MKKELTGADERIGMETQSTEVKTKRVYEGKSFMRIGDLRNVNNDAQKRTRHASKRGSAPMPSAHLNKASLIDGV